MTNLPMLPGHLWRPLHPVDATALDTLLDECAFLDDNTGGLFARGSTNPERDTIAALDNSGRIAAYARVGFSGDVAFLDGRVHPDYRGKGIGTAVLKWSIAHATEAKATRLRVDYYDRAPDFPAFLEKFGFAFSHAEDELRRTTDTLPHASLADGLTLVPWADDLLTEAHTVYRAAFTTRPHFPDWPLEKWAASFVDGADFRPAYSFLVRGGNAPVAYIVCSVDVADAWIDNLAVVPSHRGKHIADALIVEAMRRFAAAGYGTAVISVNVDNPRARRVYERGGFKHVRTYTSYQKGVET